MTPVNLTYETLSSPKESFYFKLCLIIALIGWLLLVVTLFGLIYAVIIGLIAWIAHGLLIAHLQSESVLVTPEQLPDLYATYQEVVDRLHISPAPDFYILQGNGVLNAFATRHLGRNFVVIHSNFIEAVGIDSPEIKFIMGHEIGHIKKNHLRKRALLLPAHIIPLVTEAYHRANEATCDRYGAYAAQDLDGAIRGLLVLAAGGQIAPLLSSTQFANQHYTHRSFFVSWHELISGYPTLSQRVALLKATEENSPYRKSPGRYWIAYPLAFIFNWQLIVVAYLGIFVVAALLPVINGQINDAYSKINQSNNTSLDTNAPAPTDPSDTNAVPSTSTNSP